MAYAKPGMDKIISERLRALEGLHASYSEALNDKKILADKIKEQEEEKHKLMKKLSEFQNDIDSLKDVILKKDGLIEEQLKTIDTLQQNMMKLNDLGKVFKQKIVQQEAEIGQLKASNQEKDKVKTDLKAFQEMKAQFERKYAAKEVELRRKEEELQRKDKDLAADIDAFDMERIKRREENRVAEEEMNKRKEALMTRQNQCRATLQKLKNDLQTFTF